MRELALFAGGGGGILGSHLLGWQTVCAVEIEDYPRRVLLQRQRDGILDRFPIWDDIKTFDGSVWRGRCDIVSGGFPCQDISAAGKGAGIDGERSGLWGEMLRVVCEVDPRFVYVENSPMLTSRGLYRVLRDLAALGYNARWCVLGADSVGAPHKRDRIWLLAYRDSERKLQQKRDQQEKRGRAVNGSEKLSYPNSKQFDKQWQPQRLEEEDTEFSGSNKITWWATDPADLPDTDSDEELRGGGDVQVGRIGSQEETEENFASGSNKWCSKSRVGRMAYGVDNRIHRLKALGNGQVSAVAALAFIILSEGLIGKVSFNPKFRAMNRKGKFDI